MAKIFPLSEGTFTIGHDKNFIPFNEEKDILEERSVGSLLVEIQPFLVDTGKDLVVLDTGLGFNNEQGELQIHANLRALGYEPEEVTKVLLSHLHKDHASGALFKNTNGMDVVTFPNASYYIYRPEADFALQKGAPSYNPLQLEPLLASQQIIWLDGETGLIDGYIRFTHSGGHCPQHIVYLIDDGTDKVFFGGDEAPQYKQVKMKYIAKYDFDGKKSMALREQYAETGRKEGWKFLFYHDVNTPISTINF